MADSLGSFSGLASGVQWRDLIDQIIAIEESRTLTPLKNRETAATKRLGAWTAYQAVITKFRDASSALRSGAAFDAFGVSAQKSPLSDRALFSATATASAVPGVSQIEVLDLARAEKLGGTAVADSTVALNFTGSFTVGGRQVTVAATDSLAAIRDKINAVNSGTSASRVSASILTVSTGVNRLVLSSNIGGSAGIELIEGAGSTVLTDLGLVSATLSANTIGGEARSYGTSSKDLAIASLRGVALPAAASLKVNGIEVAVDLNTDALSTIVSKINTAVGSNVARVESETINGSVVHRVRVAGTVAEWDGSGAPAQAESRRYLQELGFLRNDRAPAMQLVAPADASLVIDGVTITRSTNSISDVISGVTLNLLQAEVGTTVDLTISQDNDDAVDAIKAYASAFNDVVKFVEAQSASGAPLATDMSIRSTLRSMKDNLFAPVVGTTNTTYTQGALVGVALNRSGQLTVDESMLGAAMTANRAEVRALFSTEGRSTNTQISYASASPLTKPGSYAASITTAATVADVTSADFSAPYSSAAVADSMVVADGFTGKTATVALADGDTRATVIAKLNAAFGAGGLRLSASAVGNTLRISGLQYGAAATVGVTFKLGAAAAADTMGFTSTLGIDVAGTINGQPATGKGQLLTADAPISPATNDAQGLSVLYTGSTPGASATVTYALGIAGMMVNTADSIGNSSTGTIASQTNSIQLSLASITRRQEEVEARLERRRESLVKQFSAMEAAIARLQTQGLALTSQLSALQAARK